MGRKGKMRAAVLHAVGDIRYEEVDVPQIGPGEVLVKVKASGICASDIPRVMVDGTYHFPTIPGHEFAGEVSDKGESDQGVQVGDRVAVIPLIPCRRCDFCKSGRYFLCENYDYLGSRRDGGFAEYVCAPAENLIKLPEGVSYGEAAFTEPAAVALHALRRSGVEVGEVAAILGAGTIGLLVMQWARIKGASKVFVVDISEKKLEIAQELGEENLINAKEDDTIEKIIELTDGRGVDLVFETAGSEITQEQALRIVKRQGKVVYVGRAHCDVVISKETFDQILRKELTILGSWNSNFAPLPINEWEVVIDSLGSGKLKVKPLITHRVELERVWEIFDMMYNKKSFYNKILFVF